jgi:hypothetical protein
MFAVVGAAAALVYNKLRPRVALILRSLALMMFLPALLNICAAGWMLVRSDRSNWANSPGSALDKKSASRRRVLFLLFDEWDDRLTFKERDKSLMLPQFDAFRREAVYASQVTQPGPHTAVSIPAIITGQAVDDTIIDGPKYFLIKTHTGTHQWQKMDNVFQDARRLGVNVAIVGWYIPYCRLFGESTAACWNAPGGLSFRGISMIEKGFLDDFTDQLRQVSEIGDFSPFGAPRAARERSEIVKTLGESLSAAKRAAADESYGFVYLHLPETHWPYYYDRRTGTFGPKNNTADGYLSALALADKALGEIREAMQQSLVWDETTIVLTSDHQVRDKALGGNGNGHVPVLIHMPGQKDQITFDKPIRTPFLKDLITGVLDGSVTSAGDVLRVMSDRSGAK